jgi:hypothetical protein
MDSPGVSVSNFHGPERRPRQRRGFGEEFPPKLLGKSPNHDQAART